MGMIIKNGVEYNFGSSNTDSSSMEIVTQAEYDALVANGTMDNEKYYFITDTSVSKNATASDIPYDNTESGMSATDVQGVVDELNQNLKFPDGVGFYPDTKDGKRGYNTDPARGADTFFPFKGEYKIEIVNGNSPAGTQHNITIPPCEFFVVVALDVTDTSTTATYAISGATVLNEKVSNILYHSNYTLYTSAYTAMCEGVKEATIVTIGSNRWCQASSKQIFAYCFVN